MLYLKLVDSQGTEATFSSEIISFDWNAKEKNDAQFQLDFPDVSATAVLATTDQFFKGVLRGSPATVSSDVLSSSTLELRVIDVTILSRKGEVSVAFSGEFYDSLGHVMGVTEVPAGDWAVTQEQYDVESVEFHDSNVPAYTVNVHKVRDIALGAAWARSSRRSISPKPFAAADATVFKGLGTGIYEPAKSVAALSQYGALYKVLPSHIIDYDITQSQPPVTALDFPVIDQSVSPQPMVRKSYDANCFYFYIEEAKLGAVYFDDTKELVWTDGSRNVITADHVWGIFPDAYAVITGGDLIELYDRSGNYLSDYYLQDAPDLPRPNELYQQSATRIRGEYQFMFFPRATASGEFVLVRKAGQISVLDEPSIGGATFVAAHRFKDNNHDGQTCSAMYCDYSSKTCFAKLSITSADQVQVQVINYSLPSAPAGFLYNLPVDFDYDKGLVAYVAYWYMQAYGVINYATVLRYFNAGSGIIYQVNDTRPVRFLVSDNVEEDLPQDRDILLLDCHQEPTLDVQLNLWRVYRYSGDALSHTVTLYQTGSAADWFGSLKLAGTVPKGIFANATMTAFELASPTNEVMLQIGLNPFLSRGVTDKVVGLVVSPGQENRAIVSFKPWVADSPYYTTFDKECGRISMTLSEFMNCKYSAGVKTWETLSVQGLHTMAIGSYILAYLSKEDEDADVPTIVKVTSVSVRYSGVVLFDVSGIVVE